MIMLQGPPSGISPLPSATVHRPPSERTLSTPIDFIGGWSGPMLHSPSIVQSPTSFCSHWCSFCGSACIICSPDSRVVRKSLAFVSLLQALDINVFHLQQGIHDAARFSGISVLQELEEQCRNDLPGQAEFIFEPAALLGRLVAA